MIVNDNHDFARRAVGSFATPVNEPYPRVDDTVEDNDELRIGVCSRVPSVGARYQRTGVRRGDHPVVRGRGVRTRAALRTGLDLGTAAGSGVELERRGWQVTGVDNVKRALRRARDRIEETDVGMELVRSDVTDLARPGSAPGSGCCSIRGPSTV
jgi:hypothetical protein